MQLKGHLTEQQLNSLRVSPNKVLIKPSPGNDEITLSNGKKLFLDISYEREIHAVTTGEVIKVPPRLIYNPKLAGGSVEFDVDMELDVGDKAFFHYLIQENCLDKGKYVETENDIYFFVPYDQIYCAERKKEVVMINGWLLIEPILEDAFTSDIILTPDTVKGQPKQTEGIVRYVGKAVRQYLYQRDIVENDDEVNVGDKIMFLQDSDIPLQYELHANLEGKKTFFRMQRKDILGILESV